MALLGASFKRLMPKSFYGRALFILAAPILLVQIVSNFVFIDRHLDSVTDLLADNIVRMTKTLITLKQEKSYSPTALKDFAKEAFDFNYTFFPRKKLETQGQMPEGWAEQYLVEALDKALKYPYVLIHDDNDLILKVGLPDGVAVIVFLRKRLMSKTTQLVFYWALGMSLLTLIVASIFMRNQVRPLQDLTESMEEFGKGHEIENVHPRGATEIRSMAAAFNTMKNRIRRQVNQRTEMLANISHDLRTPITRMKLELALLSSDADGEMKGALTENVGEMERMVNEYLEFVRRDGQEPMESTDISKMVQSLRDMLASDSFEFTYRMTPTPYFMTVRPNAFKRCLMNIINNAKKYAHKISIVAAKDGVHQILYFDDDGPGIPEAFRREVFRPFYRVDSSRNTETGGVGLGLSIVKDIVNGHGGRVELDQSPMGGLRLKIIIPQ